MKNYDVKGIYLFIYLFVFVLFVCLFVKTSACFKVKKVNFV